MFRGVKINDSISISHLQFADDTILFINKDLGSVQGIKRVLQCFELLSGLKINFDKSSLYGYRTSAEDIAYWASKIGCRIGSLPIIYLGMPLGLDPSRKDFWIPLQEKFKKNLAGWKSRQVNQAGKLVMLKATLDSLPNYWFNMFLMPIGIWKELDKIGRGFFWGDEKVGETLIRKLHTINWETLCLHKNAGGLSIANLRIRNGSMLAKWVWRLYSERGKFWSKLWLLYMNRK